MTLVAAPRLVRFSVNLLRATIICEAVGSMISGWLLLFLVQVAAPEAHHSLDAISLVLASGAEEDIEPLSPCQSSS